MKIIIAVFGLLLTVSKITANDDATGSSTGPVSKIMENLAYNTAQIANEIQTELNMKIDYTNDVVLGKVEVITANAMEQLSDPFLETEEKLSNCPQSWDMAKLTQRIERQLNNCTSELLKLRTVFQDETASIVQGIQAYVVELANLSTYCQFGTDSISGISTSFASSTACFVEKLTELNQNIGQLMNQANVSLLRTRKSTRSSAVDATQCAARVVEDFNAFLKTAFQNCLVEN